MSNPEIAQDHYLSINSVKTYVRSAYRKIGATNRASAILWALRHGLAGGPDPRQPDTTSGEGNPLGRGPRTNAWRLSIPRPCPKAFEQIGGYESAQLFGNRSA